MANCAANTSRGHKFGMAAYGTLNTDPITRRFAVTRWGLRGVPETVTDDSITDTLWQIRGGEILVAEPIEGPIDMRPRPEDLQDICRAIFGGPAFVGNVKLPGDICDFFHMAHYDPNTNHDYKYNDCVTKTATFSATEKGLLELSWTVSAASRVITAGGVGPVSNVIPAPLVLSTQQPFAFRQGTLTIGGRNFPMRQFNLTIDNGIQEDFFNQLAPSERPSGAQTYVLTHDSPYDLPADVALVSSTIQQVSAELEFVSGTTSLLFEFPVLETFVGEPEVVAGQRIINSYSWRAKYDSLNAIAAPVRITVDPT